MGVTMQCVSPISTTKPVVRPEAYKARLALPITKAAGTLNVYAKQVHMHESEMNSSDVVI